MDIFVDSIKAWITDLSVNSAIMMIMMIFMLVGAIDKVMGNKYGYGEKFVKGLYSIGSLALSMVGVVAAAPVLSKVLSPIITPVYTFLGADPSMFASTLLACDMGGYPLSMELASNPSIGTFSGLILGTMMGPTLIFTIPVALGILSPKDRPYLGAGILAGLITIPLGCIAGGLAMNAMTEYYISFPEIIMNLIPVMIVALLIVAGLWFKPEKMIGGFNAFGNGVTTLVTIFTAIAVFQQITGIRLPLFDVMVTPNSNGLTPLDDGLLTCGHIGIVLIGAFPMVEWLTRTFGKAFGKLGKAIGMNDKASAGMIASLAHVLATFSIVDEMNPKGKIMAISFCVSAASVFGAHLGFTAGVDSSMVAPVIIGKLVAGFSALLASHLMASGILNKIGAPEE